MLCVLKCCACSSAVRAQVLCVLKCCACRWVTAASPDERQAELTMRLILNRIRLADLFEPINDGNALLPGNGPPGTLVDQQQ